MIVMKIFSPCRICNYKVLLGNIFIVLKRQESKRKHQLCHPLFLSFPSFSSKLRREELELLWREVDQLKTRQSESCRPTHLHWSCTTACVTSSVLANKAKAGSVMFTALTISFVFNRETGGGHVPPASNGQRNKETVWTQLQSTHTLYHTGCVCFWYFRPTSHLVFLCLDTGGANRQLQNSQHWPG